MVALGPDNCVRSVCRRYFGRVLRSRTRYRLPETTGSSLRVCKCPDPADSPLAEFDRTVSASGRARPTWNRVSEIPGVCLDRGNLSQCFAAAALVGTILSLINQADVVVGGQAIATTWIKVGLSYLVPFCVSNYGIAVGNRRSESRWPSACR